MENQEILNKLTEIFADTLDLEKVTLSRETTADDIEEWDSLTHIQLIVAIEKYFKIRFTSREVQSWKNVGELSDSINSKLPA